MKFILYIYLNSLNINYIIYNELTDYLQINNK